MSTLASVFFLALPLILEPAASSQPLAQESKASKEAAGSVSGRVTLAGKPLASVTVMLSSDTPPWEPHPPSAKATSDEDGRFRIPGVAAGSYIVSAYAPAFVSPGESRYGVQGRTVVVAEGEGVESANIALTRGGVITGRVTDVDGQPVIDQYVRLAQVNERGQDQSVFISPFRFSTDDRGVYRVYGLPAGRYRVSVGESAEGGMIRIGFAGGFYTRTFHPDTTDPAKAEIVEVTPGGEDNGVDIKVARATKMFVATGRIVEAESGAPVPGMKYAHGALFADAKNIGAFGWSGNQTDVEGRFRIEGLTPGRYAAFAANETQSDFYSEPAVFEVTDDDVADLEIKVRRGASISGVAVIEGADDPSVAGKISQLQLVAQLSSQELSAPRIAPINIAADGSFHILGLQAGKAKIQLSRYPGPPKGFTLLRVEHEKADQGGAIDVAAGAQVTGVRVVIGYGTGVIRGQVKVEGGTLPDGTRLLAFARRMTDPPQPGANAEVDARGRFLLEGLVPGDYEVSLILLPPQRSPLPLFGRRVYPRKTISITNGAEVEVTLVFDLKATDNDKDR